MRRVALALVLTTATAWADPPPWMPAPPPPTTTRTEHEVRKLRHEAAAYGAIGLAFVAGGIAVDVVALDLPQAEQATRRADGTVVVEKVRGDANWAELAGGIALTGDGPRAGGGGAVCACGRRAGWRRRSSYSSTSLGSPRRLATLRVLAGPDMHREAQLLARRWADEAHLVRAGGERDLRQRRVGALVAVDGDVGPGQGAERQLAARQRLQARVDGGGAVDDGDGALDGRVVALAELEARARLERDGDIERRRAERAIAEEHLGAGGIAVRRRGALSPATACERDVVGAARRRA